MKKIIEVRSSRIISGSARYSAPSSVIGRQEIQALGARQIADVLSFMPSVFIRNYGGLSGLKTASLRGGNASQTAVMLDEVRLQSTQSGQFDFSVLPAAFIEELEVVRGGGAALYGGSAMGGAINLRTKTDVRELKIHTEGEIASFQEYRGSISTAVPLELSPKAKSGFIAALEGQTAQGNFPFLFNSFGQTSLLTRSNGDFRNIAAHGLFSTQSDRLSLQARLLMRDSDRGTPGAVVQGSVEMARARLSENDILGSVKISYLPANQVLFSLLASAKGNVLTFKDPDARQFGINGINETFRAQDFSIQARLHFDETTNNAQTEISHDWHLEHNVSTLQGNMLQPGVGTFVERINTALAAKGNLRWQSFGTETRTNAACRLDFFSDVGIALSPLLGSAWILDSAWLLRAEWSYNFRPPAFNELYYLNFGNSRLKPERANCFNVGTSYKAALELAIDPANDAPKIDEQIVRLVRLEAGLDGFFHRTENLILAVPTSPFTLSAQNIAEAQTIGAEWSVKAALESLEGKQFAQIALNYSFQRTTNETEGSFVRGKQLIYTPQHLASAVLTMFGKVSSLPSISLRYGVNAQFVGTRFYLPSNTPESALSPFFLVGVFAEMSASVTFAEFFLRARADNLFDEQFAVIRNFPMPGRAFRLQMGVRFP